MRRCIRVLIRLPLQKDIRRVNFHAVEMRGNNPMNILVTGGAGYIGSHTCVALLEAGHTVIVADNLCNSKAETIDKIKQITGKEVTFYKIDVTDEAAVDSIFSNHQIDGIIHFAGLKAVGESVEKPLAYYYNNTVSTMVLCQSLS
jgi:UDP-glucose 4-epimerase